MRTPTESSIATFRSVLARYLNLRGCSARPGTPVVVSSATRLHVSSSSWPPTHDSHHQKTSQSHTAVTDSQVLPGSANTGSSGKLLKVPTTGTDADETRQANTIHSGFDSPSSTCSQIDKHDVLSPPRPFGSPSGWTMGLFIRSASSSGRQVGNGFSEQPFGSLELGVCEERRCVCCEFCSE